MHNEIDVSSIPYRKLWLWVLGQAVLEATGHGMNGIEVKYQHKKIAAAREWLTTDSEGLRTACELAGLDYLVVLEKSRNKFGGKK